MPITPAMVKEVFCLFDENADGLIEAREVPTLIRALGVNPSEKEISEMLQGKEADTMDFATFKQLVESRNHIMSADTEGELMKAFKSFDRTNAGTVSSSELRHLLLNLGDKLSAPEVDMLIEMGDPDKRGVIAYPTFVKQILPRVQ